MDSLRMTGARVNPCNTFHRPFENLSTGRDDDTGELLQTPD